MADNDNPPARRLVSIEDVVAVLSSECDGARKRDGRGFSRADAQEGGRLSAMKSRGMAWSAADARKAVEIAARYAKQAGDLLGDGRPSKAQGIENSLRGGRVRCADPIDDSQPPYNYACLSPGGKRVYFWRLTPIREFSSFRTGLGETTKLRHGARRVQVEFGEVATMTVNGNKVRAHRSAIDLNGSSQPTILDLCRRHDFVVEHAVEHAVDAEIDALRRHERSVWLHDGIRDGKRGTWAVFDLASKHEPFSSAVKHYCVHKSSGRRFYSCDPQDDWNWYIDWNEQSRELIRWLARTFDFAASEAILSR